MIPIPAIDLRGGQVVRLRQGDFKDQTVYSEKPQVLAKRYEEEGAQRIHVVDLDGALTGKPSHQGLVEKIVSSVGVPVELGGGIRSLETAERYFSMGVRWAILGTKACLDLGFAAEAIQEFGEKIIFGLDASSGWIATDGWTKISKNKATDLVKAIEKVGGKTVIYTDIAKDGALAGPNLGEIQALSQATSMRVIASGGVGSLKDLENIAKLKCPNVSGVIIGKALYEGKFKLAEAVKLCLPKD